MWKMYMFGYVGPGAFNDQTGHILLSSYRLTHIYMYMSNKEANW